MAVNNIVGRAEVSDALLPEQTINEIIQTAPESSVILSRARKVQMSSKKAKQPVLSSLPDAYWLDGDTGLKQTTDASWKGTNVKADVTVDPLIVSVGLGYRFNLSDILGTRSADVPLK